MSALLASLLELGRRLTTARDALEAQETPSDLGAVQEFARGFIKNWKDYN